MFEKDKYFVIGEGEVPSIYFFTTAKLSYKKGYNYLIEDSLRSVYRYKGEHCHGIIIRIEPHDHTGD